MSADTLDRLAVLAASLGISPDAALADLLDRQDAIEMRELSVVDELTPRLHTVINLLLQGMGRKQIAAQMGISIHTVNDYIKNVYSRFDVHSQSELIRRFVQGDGGDCSVII